MFGLFPLASMMALTSKPAPARRLRYTEPAKPSPHSLVKAAKRARSKAARKAAQINKRGTSSHRNR